MLHTKNVNNVNIPNDINTIICQIYFHFLIYVNIHGNLNHLHTIISLTTTLSTLSKASDQHQIWGKEYLTICLCSISTMQINDTHGHLDHRQI